MALGMCPTFARCSSLIVSVCLQISEFDSFGEWEHFRDNHAYGFATLRDRRCEAKPGQPGWVLMLLACLFSSTLSECWACLSVPGLSESLQHLNLAEAPLRVNETEAENGFGLCMAHHKAAIDRFCRNQEVLLTMQRLFTNCRGVGAR
jgi:hypothetical protein